MQHLQREKSLERSFLKWSSDGFNLKNVHHDPFPVIKTFSAIITRDYRNKEHIQIPKNITEKEV